MPACSHTRAAKMEHPLYNPETLHLRRVPLCEKDFAED